MELSANAPRRFWLSRLRSTLSGGCGQAFSRSVGSVSQIAQGVPEDESGGEQVEAGFHQLFLADMQAGIADVAHASDGGNRDEPQQQFRFVVRVLIAASGSYRHDISLYSERTQSFPALLRR